MNAPAAPHVALVVAAGRNGVIGRDGALPWRLATDMAHFRTLTMGKPVIMGRKTFQAIGRPLPDRLNIVVTRNPDFASPGVQTAPSLEAALVDASAAAAAQHVNEIAVIGGGEIYAQALPLADRVYLTEVDAAPEGDAHFPALDPRHWVEIARRAHAAGPRDDHAFEYVDYARRGMDAAGVAEATG